MTYPSILDTHLHLIDRGALNYPWLDNVPALNRDFPLERYQAEAFRCGIGAALHMEVDVAADQIEAETRQVGRLAQRLKSPLVGAISSCRPERADFPAFLERQLANPLIKGFRRVLHVVADEVSLSPVFRANVALLSGAGRPFDLCPDVQFVLDHCGAPKIKEREEHPWRERIAEIARRPNVAVKISGVVAYAEAETWTLDDIRPYVEHAILSFGWDRVVWGSDWPVCTLTASLSIWVAATHAIVKGCSLDERARLFRGNATRIWRLAA